MKKQIMSWSGVLGVVLLLSSCASTTHIEKDDTVNFSKYNTFAWAGKDEDASASELLEKNIHTAVHQELTKAGWREVKSRPDLLIDYDILVEKSVKELSNPVYSQPYSRLIYNPYTRRYASVYYPSQFLGYDREQKAVREGTVTITLIDSKTDKTVWQGWTTDEVNSRNLTSKEVQNLIKSIFKKADLAKN
ncbi:MAG: DUF4136 domain-containing protein [Bacteroidetes bacterium]|nr:MAG: DUF4136 domain-containing protein [Bacteroidota bacterium]